MIEFIGTYGNSLVVDQALETILKSKKSLNGVYYRGFPVISSPESNIKLDAILCTEEHGITVFHFAQGREITEELQDIVDEVHLKIQSKLTGLKELTKHRQLVVPITSITFGPQIPEGRYAEIGEEILLCRTKEAVLNALTRENWSHSQLYDAVLSSLHSLQSLKPKRKRAYVKNEASKGAVLKNLEKSLAHLDIHQTRAVLENIDGVQRIRGLAGSGKTIVLARKIAYIHSQQPQWKIAVTFNSRSLKAQLKRLIETFYFDDTNDYPDWAQIKIIHAWGSPRSEGLYFNACKAHNVTYHDFSISRTLKRPGEENFQAVCRAFIEENVEYQALYDLILVDEAQDFSPEFLKICYGLLTEPKRFIYAYDELQNLGNASMPSPDEIWGLDPAGNPVISFDSPSQDIILDVCYRNPGPILSAAHALGFGIYADSMIQMFEQPNLWREIGYEVEGELAAGKKVKLTRSVHSSPSLLSSQDKQDELVQFKKFVNVSEQAQWVASEIRKNIKEEEILPGDIVVIQPDTMRMQQKVGEIRTLLFNMEINSSIAGVTSSPDEFYSDNCVTFTSIYRAKGNEAAMVYIIDADYCNSPFELAKNRNILFTAMTRTKAWLRVSGTGLYFSRLLTEYQKIAAKHFALEFVYPTEEARKKMKAVNRDMTKSERSRVKAAKKNAENLTNLLGAEVNIEDIPEELRNELIKKLTGNS